MSTYYPSIPKFTLLNINIPMRTYKYRNTSSGNYIWSTIMPGVLYNPTEDNHGMNIGTVGGTNLTTYEYICPEFHPPTFRFSFGMTMNWYTKHSMKDGEYITGAQYAYGISHIAEGSSHTMTGSGYLFIYKTWHNNNDYRIYRNGALIRNWNGYGMIYGYPFNSGDFILCSVKGGQVSYGLAYQKPY